MPLSIVAANDTEAEQELSDDVIQVLMQQTGLNEQELNELSPEELAAFLKQNPILTGQSELAIEQPLATVGAEDSTAEQQGPNGSVVNGSSINGFAETKAASLEGKSTDTKLTESSNLAANSLSANKLATNSLDAKAQSDAYSVTVFDGNSCTANASASIMSATSLSSTITQTDSILCNGNLSGGLLANVAGGTAPYSFIWNTNPIQTGSATTNIGAGIYAVIVSDLNGCTTSSSFEITEPDDFSCSITSTKALCNSDSSGTAAVSIIGDSTITYAYNWSNGATAQKVVNLSSNIYTVTVSNSNGCTSTCSVQIGQSDPIIVSLTGTDILCSGDATGTAMVMASGGTPDSVSLDYDYLWSNGGTTSIISGLSEGVYIVTVSDMNGCITIDSISIAQSDQLLLDTITFTDVSCNGIGDGTASIGTVSGGVLPYTVEWNTVPAQYTATALSLLPGTYTVTVTDANGCSISGSVVISEPSSSIVASIFNVLTVGCNGGNTGSATVTVSGGTPPYSYMWSDSQTNQTAINLSAQVYVVTVTDANGCQDLIPVSLTSPLSLQVNTTTIDAQCYSDSSGSASAIVTGGTGPFSYYWININNDTIETGSIADSLYPGVYTIVVSDTFGCMAMNSFTIYEPSPVVQYTSVTSVTCNGGSDGAATSIVFAGTPPYSFLWSDGQTTQTASNLTAGNYTVAITDGNGCVSVGDIAMIIEPNPIILNANITSVLCYGSDVGFISLLTTGGTAPYQYTWSTGETTPLISSLNAGSYTVTVSDLFGCAADTTFTLIETDSISCSSTIAMPSCNGDADGTITIDSTWGGYPGTTGYTYTWSNGQTGNIATGLTVGNWFVTIEDSIGCSWTKCIKVGEPAALLCATSSTDVLCYGDTNGTIDLTVSGGSPFTISTSDTGSESYTFSGAPNPSEGEIAVVVGSVIVPAIPVGATFIGADISFYQLEAFSPSWQSEMTAELSGAYTLAATHFSTTNGSGVIGNVTLSLPGFPSGWWCNRLVNVREL